MLRLFSTSLESLGFYLPLHLSKIFFNIHCRDVFQNSAIKKLKDFLFLTEEQHTTHSLYLKPQYSSIKSSFQHKMFGTHCSQCGQTGHNRLNRRCLVNIQRSINNAPAVQPWIVPHYTSRASHGNRERLSDAIKLLADLSQYIDNPHLAATPDTYMYVSLLKVMAFCSKINQALQFDSATPLILSANIFDYFSTKIASFNARMNTPSVRVVVSLDDNVFSWTAVYNTPNTYSVKRTSEYFKELSLVHDTNIPTDTTGCDCPLCFDAVPATNVLITNCNHSFCGTCIKGYTQANKDKTKKPNCPMCRTDLTELKVGSQQVYEDIQNHILNL